MKHIAWKYPKADFDSENGKITAWRSVDTPKPSEIEVEAIRQEYISAMAAVVYKEKRAKEYPSVGDQLDAIWKMLEPAEGTEARAVKDAISAVKEKYPKPQGV